MEIRTVLAVVLSIIVLIGYQYLFVKPVAERAGDKNDVPAQVKEAVPPGPAAIPGADKERALSGALLQDAGDLVPVPTPEGVHPRDIVVENGLYKMVFSELGAGVKKCLLKGYTVDLSPDSPLEDLVKVEPPRLPLVLSLGGTRDLDLSTAYFRADKESIKLEGKGRESTLSFVARVGEGIDVVKTFTFHPGTYWVDLDVQVRGAGGAASLHLYNRPYKARSRYIFSGPSYYGKEGFQEIKLSDPGDRESYSGYLDWVAYGDNYFMTALVPKDPAGPWGVDAIKKGDGRGLVEIRLTDLRAGGAPAGVRHMDVGLYFGPKEIDRLNALGHNLSKAIDFGWFDPIAKPLLYLLKFFYRYLHNYGVAIIVLTVLIKLAFWPLAHKSAQSMKTMQKLQPKMAKLKEKYGDDKERLNKELMHLYRTYKVNPMSGCLPMLLQIPVFFALYKVLLQAIELRHAPFALWINDLSAPDRLMVGVHIPYLGGIPVLTLLMGISMYFQQKLSPSSLDPTQARMMQFLPVIFTFMFINFPSGLVLYWLVNNVLSIVQQYYVNKFTD